jgi:hypothetical protein
MTCSQNKQTGKQPANEYATARDFCSVFAAHLNDLYQLSLLVAGSHERAEHCLIAGFEDCVRANGVFKEWARCWAKRAIIQTAIRELKPHSGIASSSSMTVPAWIGDLPRGESTHFTLDAVLVLDDFERFVFVMSVLEHYSENDCALLLGSTRQQIRPARNQALVRLMESYTTVFSADIYFAAVQEIKQ